MKAVRPATVGSLIRISGLAVLVVMLGAPGLLRAADDAAHITELMAGANGDSRIQFIVVRQEGGGQAWGPQGSETQSRAMLVFFDALGRETGSVKFPSDAAGPSAANVLIATSEFAAMPGAPTPDFTMPALLNPLSGAVCFQSNPLNNVSNRKNCVSYGNFGGFTTGNSRNAAGPGAPAAGLPIMGTVSLRSTRAPNTGTDLNTDFAITSSPTPRNSAGATGTIALASTVAQGENVTMKETFNGNGRTCASCHVAAEHFRMSPANVQARFSTVASTFDPLFLGELRPSAFDAGVDFNLNTLTLAAAPANPSPCNGELRGVITTSNGGRASVLSRVSATSYLVYGGMNPSLTGQVASDGHACSAAVSSIVAGGLAVAEGVTPLGLEHPRRMRRSASGQFPQGRALILENVDGTTPVLTAPVFRKSPHFVNLSRTAPFGFSGDVPDLRAFFQGAVNQHLPRTLARSSTGATPDFRVPTSDELAAAEAFMVAQDYPPGSSTDKSNLDRFATTAAQRRGRTLFFNNTGKCSRCHGGPVLSDTTVSIQGKAIGINAAFNTGAVNQGINALNQDNLPAEAGGAREFSTPQLFNIRNLGPYFHDASTTDLAGVLAFYDSGTFNNSPAGRAIGGINLNGGNRADLVAFLESLVVRPYTLSPGPLSFAPQAPGTQSATQSITIRNTSDTPIPFAGAGCVVRGINPGDFTVTSCPLTTPLAVNESRTIQVRFNPAVAGPRSAILEVLANDQTGVALSGAVNNTSPTITTIAAQSTLLNTPVGPLAFTVADAETAAANLLVTVTSTNRVLVPQENMTVTGTGGNQTITVTPSPGATGTATITVAVTDGITTTQSSFAFTVNAPPTLAVSPAALQFGATSNAGVLQSVTAPQTVAVSFVGQAAWQAVSSETWLQLTGASGNSAGSFTALVQPSLVPAGSTSLTASITVTVSGGTNTVVMPVTLSIVATAVISPPFGAFDTPASGAAVAGSIAVTGWALDDVGVHRVELWRDRAAGETTPAYQGSGFGNGRIFVANAHFISGARSDVATNYSSYPRADSAGWGYLLLTQGLWNGGNGPYTLHAIAYDQSGLSSVLGSKTISVNNATAVKPFGAIDTPSYGEVVSGLIWNFGWAIAPDAGCTIGPGGVQVSIDSQPLQPVNYGAARADIAAAFPNATNALAAGGAFLIDTTTLSNGTHQIGWFVTDSCGNAEGIGSRFFTVLNQGSGIRNQESGVRNQESGSSPAAVSAAISPFERRRVSVRQGERVELALPAGTNRGSQIVDGQRRALPLGSSLDGERGLFYWQPDAAFLGAHDLEFVNDAGDVVAVRVIVGTAVQLVIDTPASDTVDSSFTVAGWAIDEAATDGTGIDTVHVWAYPVDGSSPVFLGVASLGDTRPDVAALFGDQFAQSSYALTAGGLPAAAYDVAVFPHSAVTNDFHAARVVRIRVQ